MAQVEWPRVVKNWWPPGRLIVKSCLLLIATCMKLAAASAIVNSGIVHAVQAVPENGTSTISDGSFVILRSGELRVLTDPVSVDKSGIRDQQGVGVSWDSVVDGRLQGTQQEAFERILKSYGKPFYELQSALQRGDWIWAGQIARTIDLSDLTADHLSHAMIQVALFRDALARGEREQAVLPLILFCRNSGAKTLAGDQRFFDACSSIDIANGFSTLLPPVWTDSRKAESVLESLANHWGNSTENLTGFLVYFSSLQLTAGRIELSRQTIAGWKTSTDVDRDWHALSLAAIEIADGKLVAGEVLLEEIRKKLPADQESLISGTTDYWIGVSRYRQNLIQAPRSSLRIMLNLAGKTETTFPSISEASLATALALAEHHAWQEVELVLRQRQQLQRMRPGEYNSPVLK